jgi:hypothetical protein
MPAIVFLFAGTKNICPGTRMARSYNSPVAGWARVPNLLGCGITPENAARLLAGLQQNSQLPEPLRVAHMIAGGVTTGESRHRA